ncbi:glycine betaine ABC transporter substrate-binding protein [Halodesulfovibrio marinisediminis]|uniref:Glycine betaine/proline transport system substrate-binding protein n=1 Tax=Halodesulfovibrio marinisediminis DSM 17456 TaxID=1121457 RepID=A0A1N6HIE9_9BACT|nr:glycine betaine ABC transporter substrate-binding protein [Halodesulfovibrio marinisediminis]SIO19540.1 glycine betaine/proline transport system substrate-binding protein [Halodesulfovibrio marinisediminis DSM 17456]
MYKSLITFLFALALIASAVPVSAEKTPIRFAVPPWAGAIVKAEIATQILEAVGYKTTIISMDADEAYQALDKGEVDVFMSAWLPTQEKLLAPLLKKKNVRVAGVNVAKAHTGLCVPGYAEAKGVKTIADLAPNATKFESTIYTTESGSGMYSFVEDLIQKDTDGLGKWTQKGEPVNNMLDDVIKAFKDKKWVVFSCWEPHWMNITLDMRYLKSADGTKMLINENTINTLIRSDIKTEYPDAFTFLSRFNVNKITQGKWTYDVSIKKQSVKETATSWIKGNLNVVRQWLGNLKAANGDRAGNIIETKF